MFLKSSRNLSAGAEALAYNGKTSKMRMATATGMERATKRERNEGRLSEAPEGTAAQRRRRAPMKFGPAVDKFFTDVFVMVDDQRLRTARLALMKRLESLILRLADISEIVAEATSRT